MCHAPGSRYRTPTSWVVRTRRSSSSTILQAMDNNERASQYIDNLVECLQSVENPGDFACGGSIPLPLPALRVHGVDELVGLPICTSQAKAIIEQCSQAPYGRGEETIVDTAVRNTWQLNPFKFTILNPEWEQRLHDLVSRRGTGMRLHCERYLPTVQAFALRERRVLQGMCAVLQCAPARALYVASCVPMQWMTVYQFLKLKLVSQLFYICITPTHVECTHP